MEWRKVPQSVDPPRIAAHMLGSLSAAYFKTSLLNNFKSQRQLWLIHTVNPPRAFPSATLAAHLPTHPSLHSTIHPSLCPSSDPISQWNHQELIPISALAGGPKQCRVRLNSAVNSQPFSQRPSLSSGPAPPFTPHSIPAYFRRALDDDLNMQCALLWTVYRARLNTLRVSSRARQSHKLSAVIQIAANRPASWPGRHNVACCRSNSHIRHLTRPPAGHPEYCKAGFTRIALTLCPLSKIRWLGLLSFIYFISKNTKYVSWQWFMANDGSPFQGTVSPLLQSWQTN